MATIGEGMEPRSWVIVKDENEKDGGENDTGANRHVAERNGHSLAMHACMHCAPRTACSQLSWPDQFALVPIEISSERLRKK
jgi:hypothetical protein